MRRQARGRLSGGMASMVVVGLVLTACSSGKQALPSGQEGDGTGIGDVAAVWETIDTSKANPPSPLISIADTLPTAGKRPAIVAGRETPPGKASRAVVWKADAVGPDQGYRLKVGAGAGDSWVRDLAVAGNRTFALGDWWQDGTKHAFLQVTQDRKTWSEVELPAVVSDQRIDLGQVAGESAKRLVALGIDDEDTIKAVLIDQAKVVTLPAVEGRATGIVGAAAARGQLVALVSVTGEDGGTEVATFSSGDAGSTWQQNEPLSGSQPSVAGLVAAAGGFLATGRTTRSGDEGASAWFSTDGVTWDLEMVPQLPGHDPGWSTSASAPTWDGSNAFATVIDDQSLQGMVVERMGVGRWISVGQPSSWVAPGAESTVVVSKGALVVLRSWNGLLQTGQMSRQGAWRITSTSGGTPVASWWSTVGQVGDATLLVAGRQVVEVRGTSGWSRTVALTPYQLGSERLLPSKWQPPQAAGSAGLAVVTDEEGNAFVAGQKVFLSASPGVSNWADVIGWFKPAGKSGWRPVRGLAGPRTELLDTADVHGGEWTVTGSDRESGDGGSHSYGALWTSQNGRAWKRQTGPFDVDSSRNSWLSGTCQLPDGSLVAVGAVEDDTKGQRPLIFRRTDGTWTPLATKPLGDDVTILSGCAGNGAVTLFQGTAAGRTVLWTTEDGLSFTRITVGGTRDYVLHVRAVAGGFLAPGSINSGMSQRAVLWLSADGRTWSAVDIPADRTLFPSDVAVTENHVVAAMTGMNGPGVAVLTNVEALMKALAD